MAVAKSRYNEYSEDIHEENLTSEKGDLYEDRTGRRIEHT